MYLKEKLIKIEGRDSSTIIAGEYNTTLMIEQLDRINKEKKDLQIL